MTSPAWACGGLVNPNGTVSLLRTSTFVGYVEGVEHYVTSFEFAGGGAEFGSIIPLPGVPTKVERAGDWTLQRLVQEVAPPVLFDTAERSAAGANEDAAKVLVRNPDRCARHHDPRRGRRRGRSVGQGERLRFDPRRPRDPRLLRRTQSDLHGRTLRPFGGCRGWAERRRWNSDPPHDPYSEPVGPVADPDARASASVRWSRPTSSSSPKVRRGCCPSRSSGRTKE